MINSILAIIRSTIIPKGKANTPVITHTEIYELSNSKISEIVKAKIIPKRVAGNSLE
jgi:hypothetical protein